MTLTQETIRLASHRSLQHKTQDLRYHFTAPACLKGRVRRTFSTVIYFRLPATVLMHLLSLVKDIVNSLYLTLPARQGYITIKKFNVLLNKHLSFHSTARLRSTFNGMLTTICTFCALFTFSFFPIHRARQFRTHFSSPTSSLWTCQRNRQVFWNRSHPKTFERADFNLLTRQQNPAASTDKFLTWCRATSRPTNCSCVHGL